MARPERSPDPDTRAWRRVAGYVRGHLTMLGLLVPVGLLALLLALYGWWWGALAEGVRTAVLRFQTEQGTAGRNIDWDALEVTGFPYAVETTLSKVRLLAPDTGLAWDGERVVMRLNPLSPNGISFSLEGEQHLFQVAQGSWLETDARADRLQLDIRQTLSGETAVLDVAGLTGTGKIDGTEFNFIVETAQASAMRAPSLDARPLAQIDLSAAVRNVALQGDLNLKLGSTIDLIDADVGLRLPAGRDLPVGATALLATWRATATPLDIRRFELEWGGVSVSATGTIKLDAQDMPEGRLSLTLGNHKRILEVLEASGWISKEAHASARPVLDVLAFVSGDPKRRITVPLQLRGGRVFLGPVEVARLQPGRVAGPDDGVTAPGP